VFHLVLLGVAGGLALRVVTRGEKPAVAAEQVQVWGSRPADVKSVSYESTQAAEKSRFNLEVRKDSRGRWYIGSMQKTKAGLGDAGAPVSLPDKPEPKQETTKFVSVKEGEKLLEQLAPLMAMRNLGKVQPPKLVDFGLDKPEGTLRVVFDNKERSLVIGGLTPNGSDRYARTPDTGEIYAVSGDLVRSLMYADSRLLERDLHDFEEGEVTRIKIIRGKASREVVPMPEKQAGWADAKTPNKLDETAGNWISKVSRVNATQYMEQPGVPVLPEYQVVKLEYFNDSKPIGFLELIKIPENKSNAGYLVKTEHTRWWAQVLKSTAEQIEQDLNSVVKK
jgi:hypothetical protein